VVVSLREISRRYGKRAHFGPAYKPFPSTHSLDEVGLDDDLFIQVRNREPGREVSL
jgi:hypothetical protein